MDGIQNGRPTSHYLLRVGEAAPIRVGGSRSRGLGFHTVKRRMGSYGRSWLRWLGGEGPTSAVPLLPLLPARVRLPPDGHGERPQRLCKRPHARARVVAG